MPDNNLKPLRLGSTVHACGLGAALTDLRLPLPDDHQPGTVPSLLILTGRVVGAFHDRGDTLQSHPVSLS